MSDEPMPDRCADVTFDLADEHKGEPTFTANLGDLLWNPKAGAGHVLVAEARCNAGRRRSPGEMFIDCGCGGWVGPCEYLVLICECGKDDSTRDHHYEILARPNVHAKGGRP